MDVIWIQEKTVIAIHREQISEHGGNPAIRDITLLKSALAKPKNLLAYADNPDIADLAASYGFGIAKNHSFVDANKRTGLAVLETFLILNGYELVSDDEMCVFILLNIVENKASELELASWIRENISPMT